MFNPEVVASQVGGPIAAMGMFGGGGTNWPGGGYGPENHIVFAYASNSMDTMGLVQPPAGYSDIRYLQGLPGRNSRFMRVLATAPPQMPRRSAPPSRG